MTITNETIQVPVADGSTIQAYLARPGTADPHLRRTRVR
jgi:hypothetical protein